ncbi:MAG: site-specific integrase [Gemmatimonadetes bacterium]|nr:site-specific integrase [Gemmatimonadota bacterium]
MEEFLTWRGTNRRRRRREKGDAGALHPRTVQKDRAVLGRLFKIAKGRKWVDHNPVYETERPEAEGRNYVVLSRDEYERFLEACAHHERLSLFALLLGETAVRSDSEALWLKWRDVDFATGYITIVSGRGGHRTKSGKTRKVPISPRLAEALRDYFAKYRLATQSEWIFHHQTSARTHKRGERIKSLRDAFDRAARKAELPENFVQHDLRHTRLTWWAEEGRNPVWIQLVAGHSDLATTMGYI